MPAVRAAAALAGFAERQATSGELLAALDETAALIAWAQARQLELIAEIARREPPVSGRDDRSPIEPAAAEVAVRLHWSMSFARDRVALAADLTGSLAATGDALRDGAIDLARAVAIAEAVRSLPPSSAAAVESAALAGASGQTVAQLRARLRRLVLHHGPTPVAERIAAAEAERRVVMTPRGDGMAELWALLPAASALAVERALSEAARSARSAEPPDDRTADQRRADLLVALVCGADPQQQYRPSVELQLAVPLGSLLGLSGEPAVLAGYGPIPEPLARRLAQDATWRRILTDPDSGVVRDVGRRRYAPPAGLDRLVRARDGTCRFPGCRRSAAGCDLDHTVAFPRGPTAESNLHALCRTHHRLKHEGGWSVTVEPGNRLRWRSPLGAEYATHPPRFGDEASTQRVPVIPRAASPAEKATVRRLAA